MCELINRTDKKHAIHKLRIDRKTLELLLLIIQTRDVVRY